jgi:hypothetical protein
MTPRTLFPDVDHLHEIGVDCSNGTYGPEGLFVDSGRTGCHDNPVQAVFIDVVNNLSLSPCAHIGMFSYECNTGFRYGLTDTATINGAGDVGSTMTDKDAYSILDHLFSILLS